MAGMLFGQVAGEDDLVLTRSKSSEEPWRRIEVLVVDAASGKVLRSFACDVTATRVQAFLGKDRVLDPARPAIELEKILCQRFSR